MKMNLPGRPILFSIFALGLLVGTLPAPVAAADVRDTPAASSDRLQGFYRVVSSTDPLFTLQGNREWFLDFGKGVTSGKTHGKVAVSLRQNPRVKVKLMVWQAFPKTGILAIGEQTEEGSRQAVELASWQIRPNSSGFMLERGNYRIVLDRANPDD